MVLVERSVYTVPELEVGKTKPYAYAPPLSMKREQVLQDGNENVMVGMLSQFSLLANYAHELFGILMADAKQTSERIISLGKRVTVVQEAAVKAEKALSESKAEQMFGNPRQEFSLPAVADAQLFMPGSAPKAVKNLHEKALKPPPLETMDPYMDEGRKCLQLYTNPNFFLDEWIAEQLKLRQAAKEERRKRREERRLRREQETKGQTKQNKKPTKLQRVVYDPHTGQKMIITVDTDENGRAIQNTPSSVKLMATQENVQETQPPVSPAVTPQPTPTPFNPKPSPVEDFAPPPPPEDFGAYPPPPSDDFSPPPPPVDDFISQPPPATFNPPAETSQMTSVPAPALPPIQKVVAVPPPPPTGSPAPPPPVPTGGPAPPPPPSAPAPPPPPPEPEPVAFNPLLAAIANKGALKKVEHSPAPKKVDAHSDLLNQIKSGKALKKVEAQEQEKAKKPAATAGSSVAEILSRRIAIVGDSDDDSEEEEDDWD